MVGTTFHLSRLNHWANINLQAVFENCRKHLGSCSKSTNHLRNQILSAIWNLAHMHRVRILSTSHYAWRHLSILEVKLHLTLLKKAARETLSGWFDISNAQITSWIDRRSIQKDLNLLHTFKTTSPKNENEPKSKSDSEFQLRKHYRKNSLSRLCWHTAWPACNETTQAQHATVSHTPSVKTSSESTSAVLLWFSGYPWSLRLQRWFRGSWYLDNGLLEGNSRFYVAGWRWVNSIFGRPILFTCLILLLARSCKAQTSNMSQKRICAMKNSLTTGFLKPANTIQQANLHWKRSMQSPLLPSGFHRIPRWQRCAAFGKHSQLEFVKRTPTSPICVCWRSIRIQNNIQIQAICWYWAS